MPQIEYTDHDLLIKLSVQCDYLVNEITGLKAALALKADAREVIDLSIQVRSLEKIIGEHSQSIASANSAVKTIGTIIGWASGAITIVYHFLLKP